MIFKQLVSDIKSYLSPKPRKGLLILGVFTVTIIHCKEMHETLNSAFIYTRLSLLMYYTTNYRLELAIRRRTLINIVVIL